MKIVKQVEPPCPCRDKLSHYFHLGAGSIVECDCGQQYILAQHRPQGKFWIKHIDHIGTLG